MPHKLPPIEITDEERKAAYDHHPDAHYPEFHVKSEYYARLVCRERQLSSALELLREFQQADDALTGEELADKFGAVMRKLDEEWITGGEMTTDDVILAKETEDAANNAFMEGKILGSISFHPAGHRVSGGE